MNKGMLLFMLYIICIIYMIHIYGVDVANSILLDLLLILESI